MTRTYLTALALVSTLAFADSLRVIDGDTVDIGGDRIRIMGLDAPETRFAKCDSERTAGHAATEALRRLLASGVVTYAADGTDRYGRTLARIFVDGEDVAGLMIEAGFAREYHGGKRRGWCEGED